MSGMNRLGQEDSDKRSQRRAKEEKERREHREEKGKCLGGSLDNQSNMFIF